MNEEKMIEHMFGENYKEKINKARIEEFAKDEKTLNLFNEVCEKISNCLISEEELVDLIDKLPFTIAVAIINSSKNINIDLATELLFSKYYNEFVMASYKQDKNGVSDFEKRCSNIKISNSNYFLTERLLTRVEVENVALNFERKNAIKLKLHMQKYDVNTTDNKQGKLLIKIHEQMVKSKNSIAFKIIDKIKFEMLTNILEKVNKYEKTIDV